MFRLADVMLLVVRCDVYVRLGDVMLCCVICYVVVCDVMKCYVLLCYEMLCYVMTLLRNVRLCYVMFRYVMLWLWNVWYIEQGRSYSTPHSCWLCQNYNVNESQQDLLFKLSESYNIHLILELSKQLLRFSANFQSSRLTYIQILEKMSEPKKKNLKYQKIQLMRC